jgi:hypothetical protein
MNLTRATIIGFALFFALWLMALIAGHAAPAFAQEAPLCAPRAEVLANVASKYEEVLQGRGLAADGNKQLNSVMEMYANEETGTWTILQMTPGGMACLVAYGQYWSASVAPKKGDPA